MNKILTERHYRFLVAAAKTAELKEYSFAYGCGPDNGDGNFRTFSVEGYLIADECAAHGLLRFLLQNFDSRFYTFTAAGVEAAANYTTLTSI